MAAHDCRKYRRRWRKWLPARRRYLYQGAGVVPVAALRSIVIDGASATSTRCTSMPRLLRAAAIGSGASASATTAASDAVGQNVANAARSHFVWSTRPTTSVAARDEQALDLRLLLGRIGETGLEREPRRAHERPLDVDLVEQALAQRAHEAERLPADEARGHRDGDAGMAGELGGDPQAVGDDGQVEPPAARREVPGHRQRRGAGVERDALAVDDHRRSSAADRVLLGSLEALADVERALGTGPAGDHRAAVRPDEAALLLQQVEVLADRDARHAEQAAELGNAGAAVLLDDPRDVLLALLGEHVAAGRLDGHGHLCWTADGSGGVASSDGTGTPIAMSTR